MRFVRGRYYLITSERIEGKDGRKLYWLVEFHRRMRVSYDVYVLATSHDQSKTTDQSPFYSTTFLVESLRDPRMYTVKEVSTTDLLLYFGDYVSRRYKDILSGIDHDRVLSKSVQGKTIALKRKSRFVRKSF
jgi:hypothetical protein